MERLCPVNPNPTEPFACYKDWNTWLSIDPKKINDSYFVLDLLILVSAYMTRYFVSENDE